MKDDVDSRFAKTERYRVVLLDLLTYRLKFLLLYTMYVFAECNSRVIN